MAWSSVPRRPARARRNRSHRRSGGGRCERHRRKDRRLLLVRGPLPEFGVRHRVQAELHVRVRRTTELGAEAVPRRGRQILVRREPQVIRAVRNQVTLATHLRNPEGVQDVDRLQLKVHRATARQIQLVRGRDAVLRVAELPPPLMPDHLDLQRIRRGLGLRREDRADRRNRDEDQDDSRNRRPGDLERGIAMHLLGHTAVGTTPELEDRVDESGFDSDENERTPKEQLVPERIDRGVEVRVRIERRIRILAATRCEP